MHLRYRQQMMEYITKIKSISYHPTQGIFKASKHLRLKEACKEIQAKVNMGILVTIEF